MKTTLPDGRIVHGMMVWTVTDPAKTYGIGLPGCSMEEALATFKEKYGIDGIIDTLGVRTMNGGWILCEPDDPSSIVEFSRDGEILK